MSLTRYLKFLRFGGHIEKNDMTWMELITGEEVNEFSREFKLAAVGLSTSGVLSVAQAARELRIPENAL